MKRDSSLSVVLARVYVGAVIALTVVTLLAGCSTSDTTESDGAREGSAEATRIVDSVGDTKTHSMPSFEIIKQEESDTPIKAQIVITAIVSGDVTEEGLESLLTKLYEEAREETGFLTYHDEVTNVYIYLFSSREYAESGYQWIAMLDKSYDDPGPDITIDENRLGLYLNPPQVEINFGLTESQRKEIFKDYIRAEERAGIESMERYPDLLPSAPGYSQDAFLAQLYRQTDEQGRLGEIYKEALAEENGLTRDELSKIVQEGLKSDWAMPRYGS